MLESLHLSARCKNEIDELNADSFGHFDLPIRRSKIKDTHVATPFRLLKEFINVWHQLRCSALSVGPLPDSEICACVIRTSASAVRSAGLRRLSLSSRRTSAEEQLAPFKLPRHKSVSKTVEEKTPQPNCGRCKVYITVGSRQIFEIETFIRAEEYGQVDIYPSA
ncbi:hypothetical protein EVAR_62987_1 [Eumeta japonica]|uniref:Uncharacterized protein n=1 Tax=Eumeta variegata TaxID=151549 RepID=A0A4C1ZQI8_EUMVA|nr:hypothetical protein EVAR_62987_1 [Eumeta japonica]